MSSSKDGGRAFPDPAPREDGAPGMSLRDWFAGQALRNCSYWFAGQALRNCSYKMVTPEHQAWLAYELADAMLAEREKEVRREG